SLGSSRLRTNLPAARSSRWNASGCTAPLTRGFSPARVTVLRTTEMFNEAGSRPGASASMYTLSWSSYRLTSGYSRAARPGKKAVRNRGGTGKPACSKARSIPRRRPARSCHGFHWAIGVISFLLHSYSGLGPLLRDYQGAAIGRGPCAGHRPGTQSRSRPHSLRLTPHHMSRYAIDNFIGDGVPGLEIPCHDIGLLDDVGFPILILDRELAGD